MLRWTIPILSITCVLAQDAAAQFEPAWTWNRLDNNGYIGGGLTNSRGYEFTVNTAVTVTEIGLFDSELSWWVPVAALSFPGFAQEHEVGLWDKSMPDAPLATAMMPAGQVAQLCQDGYRYVAIDPTVLQPGVSYVVAALWPRDDGTGNSDPYPVLIEGSPVTPDPRINLVHSLSTQGETFVMPSTVTTFDLFRHIGLINMRLGPGVCEPNPPADLMTTFQSDCIEAGSMFDLHALHPDGLTVNSWQINLENDVTNDTPIHVTVYRRHGTYEGHTASSDGWNMLGEAWVLSWGPNQPTPLPVGGLTLPFDEVIGMYITTDSTMLPPDGPPTLRMSGIGDTGLPLYANADLEITGGVSVGDPPFGGASAFQEIWNGGVFYSIGVACAADVNGDGVVDVQDLVAVILAWGTDDPAADVNDDGVVGIGDLIQVILEWNGC